MNLNIILAPLLIVFFALAGADLQSDLLEFNTIIPIGSLSLIAARHFILDQDFRETFMYVRSEEFAQIWQQIRNSPEFRELYEYVERNSGVDGDFDITDLIVNIPNELRAYNITEEVPVNELLKKDFSTFLEDVLDALPQDRIADFIARKIDEGSDFGKVYEAMRNPEYRELWNKARNSPNLAVPLQRLDENGIKIDDLITSAFTILSWGP